MFDTLLESRAGRSKRSGGAAASIAAHVAIIIGAVVATGNATTWTPVVNESLVPIPVYDPVTRPRTGTRSPGGGNGGVAGPVLRPPDDIVPGIPPFEVGVDPIGEIDPRGGWESTEPVAGRGRGTGEGAGPRWEFEVEKPAVALPNNPVPRYPEILRAASVGGRVLVRFVVDTTGRAEPSSIAVLASTHELFASAVRATIPSMRFLPAETGGRKVRMWVQMPFEFAIAP